MRINTLIHHITQISSIVLAWVWFGWHGMVVSFLINWSANTHERS
jgi:glucose-6-phosphate-specific signal transduction histidine kinase